MTADLQLRDEGTIVLIIPSSPAGQAWVDEHLPEDAPRFGGAVAAEPRYVAAIVEGATDDGLEVA